MAHENLPFLRKRRSDPWSSFQDEVSDLVNRFSGDWGSNLSLDSDTQFSPKIDVKDEGQNFLVTAEIPGMDEKDIDINIEDNVLTLQGERKSEHTDEDKKKGFYRSEISYGSFYRTIPFNETLDEDKVEANYKHGMLKVILPKKEGAKKKGRKISIGGVDQKKH